MKKIIYCLCLQLAITYSCSAFALVKSADTVHNISKTIDSAQFRGNVSISGLLQTGNENRFVIALLTEMAVGNKTFEVLPLTSIAYSSKPHAQVEGEYLEYMILRFYQGHFFYPATGLSFEKSFLRKIDFRYSAGVTAVLNLLSDHQQSIKLGIGVNYDFTQYIHGSFLPVSPENEFYHRHLEQVYIRLKGVNPLFNKTLVLSYDFFYQPTIANLNDYRWTMIANMDIPLNKKFSFRVSSVDSYEGFVAANVHHNNFRLTFGMNLTI
jgi:Protein of unknown function, DUF481